MNGKNYKSRRIVFKTNNYSDGYFDSENLKSKPATLTKEKKFKAETPEIINPDPTAIGSKYTPQTSAKVSNIKKIIFYEMV